MRKTVELNAKVAAVCIVLGAVLLHFFNQINSELIPLRILTLVILVMGAWAFSDEMGLRKPLNRAGLIVFLVSVMALAVTILEPAKSNIGKYYLLYSFTLLFAILIWSLAFMHRKQKIKAVGKLGFIAAAIPIVALVVGHLSVAVGAFIGVDVLLNMSGGHELLRSIPVKVIEAMFIFWAIATAVMLWSGKLSQASQSN